MAVNTQLEKSLGILAAGYVSKEDLKTIINRISHGIHENVPLGGGVTLSPGHVDDLIKFLTKNTWSRSGKAKKDAVLREYEKAVLQDFNCIILHWILDIPALSTLHLPYYKVIDGEGNSFIFTIVDKDIVLY